MAVGILTFPAAPDSLDNLIRAANDSATTLSAALSEAATSATVSDTSSFPDSGSFVIEDEVIYYEAKTATTFTGLQRAREATSAAAHALGLEVEGQITAGHKNVPGQAIVNTQTFALDLEARIIALESGSGVSRPGVFYAADFGASGSSVTTTGTIAAGSTSLAVASSASFAVGQGIFITNAGSAADATGTFHVSKITAISGNTITIETAAVRAASGVLVKHDDTLALQAAIDACAEADSGTLELDLGTYFCNGPLTDFNSILKIPLRTTGAGVDNCAVRIRGTVPQPGGAWLGAPNTAALISSSRRGSSDDSSILACALFVPGTGDTTANATAVYLEDIIFRTYDDPAISGLDLGMCQNPMLKNVMVDTGRGVQDVVEPTHGTFGIRWPRANITGLAIADCCSVFGYGVGQILSEEFVAVNAASSLCKVGFRLLPAPHASSGRLQVWQCPTGIEFTGALAVDFSVDFESGAPATWKATPAGRYIYDPADVAAGFCKVHLSEGASGVGNWAEPSFTGCSKMTIVNLNGFPNRFIKSSFSGDLAASAAFRISDGEGLRTVTPGEDDSGGSGSRHLVIPNSAVPDLSAGLVAFYRLDESSGTRLDSMGSAHLSPAGELAVGFATGKMGNAATFTRGTPPSTGARLEAAHVPAFDFAASFTVAFWVLGADFPASAAIVSRFNDTFGYSWLAGFSDGAVAWQFGVSAEGTSFVDVQNTTAAHVSGTWYFFCAGYDSAAAQIWITVNDSAPITAAFAGPVHAGTSPLTLGYFRFGGFPNYSAMSCDCLCLYARKLSAAEISALYNSGAGRDPLTG